MEMRVVNDSLHGEMFKATVSDIYVSAFAPHFTDFVTKVTKLEDGTYDVKTDGVQITWTKFNELMSQVNI